jgi:hypothetical protein
VIEETKQKPTEEKTEKKILSQYCKKWKPKLFLN